MNYIGPDGERRMTAPSRSLKELFLAALDVAPEDRAAWLERECAADAGLCEHLRLMLAAHDEPQSLLDRPAGDPAASLPREGIGPTVDQPMSEGPGTIIGPYKLLEPIGEGGMGTVWMAQQQEPVRRLVALKLVKAGMDSKQVIARFEAERQALALMDHANIARVLDAGTTSAGLPYFVMDLVKGVPITRYCDEHRLTPRQRLELFVPVCQAVQHAHQKGIIHRDLKPSNVLVALYDGQPVPKVIDFGVAKAAGQPLTDKTLVTGFGNLVGTLEYMSPEQAEINQLDIDTRSDIYALGVLLYELLTGGPPFSRKELEPGGVLEMLRVIREQEPTKPSAKLSTAEGLPTLAANRGTEPAKLARLVRGELDWIVMKALDKDRNRRYESASAFAADVQRYLHDEVVRARPPSAGYRFGKFIRRYKGRVAAAVALAVALLTGGAAVIAVQARADRDRAADRAAREAGTTASVAAATREARERADEAWDLYDDPDRMQRATDAAVSSMGRADDFAAHGAPTGATLDELASTRKLIDELARHTRLIAAYAASREQFAYELTIDFSRKATANLCKRHDEALRQFGLDPINDPADEVARAVADSRIRDPLLGMLAEWQSYAATLGATAQTGLRVSPSVAAERLGQVIRSARRLCGGAYARWQELLERNDVPGLVAFAAADGLSFRSTLAAAVGRDLLRAKQHAACRTFLRAAVDRYPYDAWLHNDLHRVCRDMRPPDLVEALGHISAASALRPDSAVFHHSVGDCYLALGSIDQAVVAHRKASALRPESAVEHLFLGNALSEARDWDGAVAAFRAALRLRPDDQRGNQGLVYALGAAGRHVEAREAPLATLRQNPALAEPRSYFRLEAACNAMNAADGKGPFAALPAAERSAYRKQALDLLTDALAAIRALPATDRTFVHQTMQVWLGHPELKSVRDRSVIGLLPPDERDAWNKLWEDVRDLRGRMSPPEPKK
jgi:serine/threonine protein kinase